MAGDIIDVNTLNTSKCSRASPFYPYNDRIQAAIYLREGKCLGRRHVYYIKRSSKEEGYTTIAYVYAHVQSSNDENDDDDESLCTYVFVAAKGISAKLSVAYSQFWCDG